jgi:hypothetical protein
MNKRKKLRRRIVTYLNTVPDWESYNKLESEELETVTIDLDLSDSKSRFNPYSWADQQKLNPEIYAYLDAAVYPLPVQIKIVCRIHGVSDTTTQKQIRALLMQHYYENFMDKKLDLAINRRRFHWLFFIGIILMIVYFIMVNTGLGAVLQEVASIIATVILWSACEFAFIDRQDLIVNYFNAFQTADIKVEFAE